MHYQRRSARIGQHYLLTPKLTSGQCGHESVKSCQGSSPSRICAIVVQPQIWKQRRWIQSSLYILEIYFWGWRLSRWQVGLSGNLVASSVLPRNWIGNSSLHPGGNDGDDGGYPPYSHIDWGWGQGAAGRVSCRQAQVEMCNLKINNENG